VLFVTHDQVEALSLSDRIALMSGGKIQQQGTPRELYENPINAFTRDFVGKTLLFRGRVVETSPPGRISAAVDGAPNCVVAGHYGDSAGLRAGEPVCIAVRPEDVDILPVTGGPVPAGMIGGTAHAALFLGERFEYQIEVDGQHAIVIYGDRHNALPEGGKVWLRLRSDGHSLWPADWS